MTDNDLRIKVAKLLGWTRIGPGHDCVDGRQVDVLVGYTPKDDPDDRVTVIPDYPKDLNACFEFEETLPKGKWVNSKGEQIADWEEETDRWVEPDGPTAHKYMVALMMATRVDSKWASIHATARQRCEAFVETMEAR